MWGIAFVSTPSGASREPARIGRDGDRGRRAPAGQGAPGRASRRPVRGDASGAGPSRKRRDSTIRPRRDRLPTPHRRRRGGTKPRGSLSGASLGSGPRSRRGGPAGKALRWMQRDAAGVRVHLQQAPRLGPVPRGCGSRDARCGPEPKRGGPAVRLLLTERAASLTWGDCDSGPRRAPSFVATGWNARGAPPLAKRGPSVARWRARAVVGPDPRCSAPGSWRVSAWRVSER